MLNRILEISLTNRLLVLLTAVALSMTGIVVVKSMEVDVFPDLTAPTVTVLTESHGMEAEEVEQLVTYKIESGLNGSPNVRRIRSSSAAGISIVWVEFEWGTSIYRARQIVNEKLPLIGEKLPEGVGDPTLAPVSSIMGEILLLSVSSDSLSPMEIRTLADWEILPRIKSVRGVANVVTIGGEFKQYQVQANPWKMDHYGISLHELETAVEASSHNASGGFFNAHGKQYIVKAEGRAQVTDDIAEGLVKKVGGQAIAIGDVADVRIGASDKIGDGAMNGDRAVIMTITKQPETNTLDLTRDIDAALADLRRTLPPGVDIEDRIFRQADFIQASIDNLQTTLLEGAFFVVLVLFLFLMNWRTTLISLLAIPLSLLVSFVVLRLLGYTINTMSLGGMAIAIGALVDDAIIDVENVFRHLRENIRKPKAERLGHLEVVFRASSEIRSSIMIATLIIIVSFIPLFFLGGMEGRLLTPLGIAFVTSVLTSLVVAVTVTPVLCSYLLGREQLLLRRADGTRIERFLQDLYRGILKRLLRYPRMTVAVTLLAFALSVGFATRLGRSFLPDFNEGALVISVVGPPAMSLEESNKIGRMAERALLKLDEIEMTARRTGRSELDEHAQGVHASEIEAPFILKARNKEDFLAAVRAALAPLPGVNVTVGMPIAHRIDHMLSGTRANIAIKVFGPDLQQLFRTGKRIQQRIASIPGLVDVSVEQQVEVPQIRIRPKPVLLKKYGLTVKDFAHFVDVAFAGETVSQIIRGQRSFDLVVRYDTSSRGSIEKMRRALIDTPEGDKIELGDVATFHSISSPYNINREHVARKVVVSANVSGRDLRGAVQELKAAIEADVPLPEGTHIAYGGQFESEAQASTLLFWSSIFAILIIFLLLYFEFNNLKLAGIVLLNLPLALIGGILIVYLTSGIVSIASTIGFISLFGIATRNGILLISHYQDLKDSDYAADERILKGSIDRLNPILMTALTTTLALVPLALQPGEAGNEIQSPMAVVILGGLLSATVLNLFVVPCVYKLTRSR